MVNLMHLTWRNHIVLTNSSITNNYENVVDEIKVDLMFNAIDNLIFMNKLNLRVASFYI